MRHYSPFVCLFVIVTLALAQTACSDADDILETSPDTPQVVSPFTRAAAEDSMTIKDFRRSYGVGFSFDGIWGERCNFRDVHSRVFDLDAMRKWSEEHGQDLFSSTVTNETTNSCTSHFSHSEYKQSTTFYADADAHLIVFNGEYQTSSYVYEEGETNNFFCDVEYIPSSMRMDLDNVSLRVLVKDYGNTELLTPNFREVIDWMGKYVGTPSMDAVIDSFLICYGSHVVTSASVGGSIKIHMEMEHDSLITIYSSKSLGEATIAHIISSSAESEEYRKELNLLNSADCSISIKGGDLSTIPNELLHFRFGNKPELTNYVEDWASSLNYNPNDYAHNNLEMIDMKVVPIWNFIPNEEVARLVKLRVEGTSKELISEFGYQNFTNTSFQLPQSVTCNMGGQSTSFNTPAITNVIASGRYVATICRETIDLPEQGQQEVQVVYPIYNQQVNLRSGYTTYGGSAYCVRWTKDKCYVEKDTVNIPSADGTIYMTHGVPGSIAYVNVNYQPSHTVIGYEWPMAIMKDGTVDTSKPYYLTY